VGEQLPLRICRGWWIGAEAFTSSDVAGSFLHQLHTGRESEFGVDVG
jgi:hypothetical protein